MMHFLDRERMPYKKKLGTKRALEDDDHEALNKRNKASLSANQRTFGNSSLVLPSQYDPLSEPSPLGLHLKKSPSLLDFFEMKLSKESSSAARTLHNWNLDRAIESVTKCVYVPVTTEKLKASNFLASFLRIGSWEYKSRYEGDLVVKCYFAKHKLVWEVLDGGLKSKIEIQWSDITGLKAECPADGPGTLTVVLARQPSFFRESNPQPRKHTLWHATTDFTNGEATKYRQHFLQCPQGLLNKHFEKIIHCDMRLNFLSRQPDVLESPFFEQMTTGNPSSSMGGSKSKEMLNELAEYLLGDTQCRAATDEKSLMQRVNSLCCLMQQDSASVQTLQVNKKSINNKLDKGKGIACVSISNVDTYGTKGDITPYGGCANDTSGRQQTAFMSRRDSFSDMLFSMPPIRTSKGCANDTSSCQQTTTMSRRGSISDIFFNMSQLANNASSSQHATIISREDSFSDLLFNLPPNKASEGFVNNAPSFQQTTTISKKDSFSNLLFNLPPNKVSEEFLYDAPSFQQTTTISKKDSFSNLLFHLPPNKASEGFVYDAPSFQQTTTISKKDSFSNLLFNLPPNKASEGFVYDAPNFQQTTTISKKDSFSNLLFNLPSNKASEGFVNDAASFQQTTTISKKDSFNNLLFNLSQAKAFEGCANETSSYQQSAFMSRKDSLNDLLFHLPRTKPSEGCANGASNCQQVAVMSRKDSLSDLLFHLHQSQTFEGSANGASSSQQTATMSRQDSFSDLLFDLPRIESLPKFMLDISEDDHRNK